MIRSETLIEPPSRVWNLVDTRPLRVGRYLEVVDLSKDSLQAIFDSNELKPPEPPGDYWRDALQDFQLTLWAGTRWVRPRPRAVRHERWRGAEVTVLESEYDGRLLDFSFDRKSWRLVRYVARGVSGERAREYRFADYVTIDGILLPSTVEQRWLDMTWKERWTYRLNVDYAPALFSEPPSLPAGANGWMRVPPALKP